MFFCDNRLYFDSEDLEPIRALALASGQSVIEVIETTINDKEPDFIDAMKKVYGGLGLYSLETDPPQKIGEIGHPRHEVVH